MTGRLIRITTALAVATVAAVATVISCRHAYRLVRSHSETGVTARLVRSPSAASSLATSMLILDATRKRSAESVRRATRNSMCLWLALLRRSVGSSSIPGWYQSER